MQEWEEEAPKRRFHKRGKYKTYRGNPCKTEQEKKEAKAQRQKRYMMNKNTRAARERAETNKDAFTFLSKVRKTSDFKKMVAQLAELKAENAQLRTEVEQLKKTQVAPKPQDAYRRKMFNRMVDTLVEMKKKTVKR